MHEPGGERLPLKQLNIFVEDVTTNIIFVNLINHANHQLATLRVKARLKGTPDQHVRDIPEAATVSITLTLPLTTYVDEQLLEFQLGISLAGQADPVETPWMEWDLTAGGNVISLTWELIAQTPAISPTTPNRNRSDTMAMQSGNTTPPTARAQGGGTSRRVRGTPNALSLHIGLNHVDPSQYQDENGDPWDGELAGCINDARDMQDIAVKGGFRTTLFTDDQATSAEVIKTIARCATELTAGDIMLLTYSGHGGQVPDVNGDDEDGMDETWCLFDRMLIDDELYSLWSQFEAGVRVVVLSDSCHSGTMLKQVLYANLPPMTPVIQQFRARYAPSAARAVETRAQRLFREVKPPKTTTCRWACSAAPTRTRSRCTTPSSGRRAAASAP